MPGPTEAKTRKQLIDPALARAGWDVGNPSQVGIEIPVDGFDPAAWKRLAATLKQLRSKVGEATLPAGVSDYILYRPNHEILAVVEAKRASADARIAEAQTEFYVTELEKRQSFRPFAFMANGYSTYFWDIGRSNKRLVSGFFSPDDLEQLLYIRQNGIPLSKAPINLAITDRVFQQEAIRRVCEAFEQGKRRALIVMATGTGKTRVAMSLVDLFIRANQGRRILFVADRDVLVEQAIGEGFEAFIPSEPCTRITTQHIDKSCRLYAVTLQTLSNCFEHFTPSFFDLIIFDEVHRSIFNKWNEVLAYFDGRMIGLTATPADFIDRNTFIAFDCDGSTPTFLYSYDQAIQDGYLVDFTPYAAQTRFQRRGIRGVDLTEEERAALIEQGIDPDELDYAGTDLEEKVSNRDTLRRQWEEIMEVCYKDESGQLPGKTIVFAMTQAHALRLAEVFDEMYPQYPGLVRVITHTTEYRGRLVEDFKKESLPRIAISVDMLETGINVPEVVNLVFMRPVQSRIKLAQMLGRGTRTEATCKSTAWLPGGHKREFRVIDFWENDFGKGGQEAMTQDLPILVTIFNTRLKLLEVFRKKRQTAEIERVVAALRGQVAQIPTASFLIQRIWPDIEQAWEDSFWLYLSQDRIEFLRNKVGPLLRYVPAEDVPAATFTSKVERLKLLLLTGQNPTATVESIAEDVGRLPDFVYQDAHCRPLVQLCLGPQLRTATVDELDQVIAALASQMKNRRAQTNAFLYLDLPDYIEMRGYIFLAGGTQQMYVEEYRRRVEQKILDLAASHPTVAAMQRGERVSDRQLLDLERTLRRDVGGGEVELSEDNIRKAYGLRVGSLLEFLRHLLDIEDLPDYAAIVHRQFEKHIARHHFNADQIRFLRAVASVLLERRRLGRADLYEQPLSSFGQDAVERWFTPAEVRGVLALAQSLTVTGE